MPHLELLVAKTIEAYRNYYNECKFEFVKYAHQTPVPSWFVSSPPLVEKKRARNKAWEQFSLKKDRRKSLLLKKVKTLSLKISHHPLIDQLITVTQERFEFE